MPEIPDEQAEKIIRALEERGVRRPCPRCGNTDFSLAGGYFTNVLTDDISTVQLSGQVIPTIAVICSRCGFFSQHALGTLGMLPAKEPAKVIEE